MELACEVEARVQEATCCSILYYHRVILPIYLTHYQQECEHPHCIHVSDSLSLCIHSNIIRYLKGTSGSSFSSKQHTCITYDLFTILHIQDVGILHFVEYFVIFT